MPTTRRQTRARTSTEASQMRTKGGRKKEAKQGVEQKHEVKEETQKAAHKAPEEEDKQKVDAGEKRNVVEAKEDFNEKKDEPPVKRQKLEEEKPRVGPVYKPGVIERGHIYFFYRPRVQLEETHSIDEVRNFHMLLIPAPPAFAAAATDAEHSTGIKDKPDPEKVEEAEMQTLEPGADTVPASPPVGESKRKYRLVTIGKKRLPDPENLGSTSRRKEIFWATVTALGGDLEELRSGLGPKTYETKTRGTRHEAPCRIAGRGAYAIVNTEAKTPSQRETHLGYHISHPPPSEMGDVQKELGIASASSFVVQVKNPLAPASGPQPVRGKGASYPDWLMRSVFGTAGEGETESARGREEYGLRFTSCETPELLDYLNTQLLMIAARSGEEGLEQSLGEGRGEALSKAEDEESNQSISRVFEELGGQAEKFPAEPLEGEWI